MHSMYDTILRKSASVLVLLRLLFAPDITCAETRSNETNQPVRTVVIHARVPDGTAVVYLTGNCPQLGNWDPHGFAMTGSGRERTANLQVPQGTELEYKFTLGSWQREALDSSGGTPPNQRLTVDTNKEVTIDIPGFKKDIAEYIEDWKGSGVLGRLEYWKDVRSQFLANSRHVEIWLPPGYDEKSTNRYDVLYMHDGQNLFDPRIANTGVDWGVDEAVVRNVKEGKMKPLIVVGVWCTVERAREYSPWDLGTNYAKFLIEELMPRVNNGFRTRTGGKHTAVMGSSMGGLISFWLCWKYPESFGLAGCLSTHFPWNGIRSAKDETPFIEREIAAGATFPKSVRVYMDYGTVGIDSIYEPSHNRVSGWLSEQGLKEGVDYLIRKFPGANHNEAAWRARLDEPLLFLFGSKPME